MRFRLLLLLLLLLLTFYNGMHTTTASSQYIVIGPAVEQFVTRLCIDIDSVLRLGHSPSRCEVG